MVLIRGSRTKKAEGCQGLVDNPNQSSLRGSGVKRPEGLGAKRPEGLGAGRGQRSGAGREAAAGGLGLGTSLQQVVLGSGEERRKAGGALSISDWYQAWPAGLSLPGQGSDDKT